MQKYKICPDCKTKNAPALFECTACGYDLAGIKITDEETEKMLSGQTAENTETPHNLVRICDCGAKNPSNARKCADCGEDISDITPTADTETSAEKPPSPLSFALSSLDGKYAFNIPCGQTTIGRATEMGEYMKEKMHVSKSHARLTLENGELYIENINPKNFTFVNNVLITTSAKLQDGDEIGLGGDFNGGKRYEKAAYFLVRIGQCT